MSALQHVLGFDATGKLEKLCWPGFPNLLYECQQEVDLGGRRFWPAGWDECFPTIEPYGGSPVMGELVGVAPSLVCQPTAVEQIWSTPRFEARRRFVMEGPTCLCVHFQAAHRQGQPLEILWASHALFTCTNLQRLRTGSGLTITDFSLDGSVSKTFLDNTEPVELSYRGFVVTLTTDQPYWGLWLNRGGWPANNAEPFGCLGVEATNAPGEQPAGRWLGRGETFSGQVRLDVQAGISP